MDLFSKPVLNTLPKLSTSPLSIAHLFLPLASLESSSKLLIVPLVVRGAYLGSCINPSHLYLEKFLSFRVKLKAPSTIVLLNEISIPKALKTSNTLSKEIKLISLVSSKYFSE